MQPTTTAAATLAPSYTVLDTQRVSKPRKSALLFGACLAADKGYSSRLVRVPGGWDVVASDNRAIRFIAA